MIRHYLLSWYADITNTNQRTNPCQDDDLQVKVLVPISALHLIRHYDFSHGNDKRSRQHSRARETRKRKFTLLPCNKSGMRRNYNSALPKSDAVLKAHNREATLRIMHVKRREEEIELEKKSPSIDTLILEEHDAGSG